MQPPASDGQRSLSAATRISREVVRALHGKTGRGATSARTTIGRDHVMVMLEETLTTQERTLIDGGHGDHVLDGRHAIQQMIREETIAFVERTMNREVIGFMSANHLDPDLAVEVFVLDPASRTEGEQPSEG